MSRVEEIRKRCEAATSGPWEIHRMFRQVWSPKTQLFVSCEADGEEDPDANFIAHSREDVPYLLALIEKDEAALRQIRNEMSPYVGSDPKHDSDDKQEHWFLIADEALSEARRQS